MCSRFTISPIIAMLLGGAFVALPQSNNIIAVAAGGDLQDAIERAAPGDTIA